ncbi:MAG: pyridoxine 5'-phosphate synthase [Rhizomicrobium sp.]
MLANDAAAVAAHLAAARASAAAAGRLGLEVHAGHGLTYDNVKAIAAIPQVRELNIGHFLIGEAIFVGLENSIRRMRALMDEARGLQSVAAK